MCIYTYIYFGERERECSAILMARRRCAVEACQWPPSRCFALSVWSPFLFILNPRRFKNVPRDSRISNKKISNVLTAQLTSWTCDMACIFWDVGDNFFCGVVAPCHFFFL